MTITVITPATQPTSVPLSACPLGLRRISGAAPPPASCRLPPGSSAGEVPSAFRPRVTSGLAYTVCGAFLARRKEKVKRLFVERVNSGEIAHRQSAKSPELRAVMSLSRLWQQQGKQKEAHRMLSEIYGWFTEGFDTKDLQEAKALLQKLV